MQVHKWAMGAVFGVKPSVLATKTSSQFGVAGHGDSFLVVVIQSVIFSQIFDHKTGHRKFMNLMNEGCALAVGGLEYQHRTSRYGPEYTEYTYIYTPTSFDGES